MSHIWYQTMAADLQTPPHQSDGSVSVLFHANISVSFASSQAKVGRGSHPPGSSSGHVTPHRPAWSFRRCTDTARRKGGSPALTLPPFRSRVRSELRCDGVFYHLLSGCRFDGVDGLAEQEEFLPHKTGAKKEIRFTDVSAETPRSDRRRGVVATR